MRVYVMGASVIDSIPEARMRTIPSRRRAHLFTEAV
jgi:hypothetical protein